ncbi:unnamed protein product, partial [Ascophyllum nodosum]
QVRWTYQPGHTGGRSHRIFHPPSFCGHLNTLSEGNPCTGLKDFGMYECTRGLEDSVY